MLPMAKRFVTKPVPTPHGWASLSGQPPGSLQPDKEAAHQAVGTFGEFRGWMQYLAAANGDVSSETWYQVG